MDDTVNIQQTGDIDVAIPTNGLSVSSFGAKCGTGGPFADESKWSLLTGLNR